MLKIITPDAEWVARANENGWTKDSTHPFFEPLKEILLAIGGWAVCIPPWEEDFDKLLARGRKFPGKSRTIRGRNCQCHSNTAALWRANRKLVKICTGYALTRDGMWRQHSWGLHDNAVIETTEKRIQYFGFILTTREAVNFNQNNP